MSDICRSVMSRLISLLSVLILVLGDPVPQGHHYYSELERNSMNHWPCPQTSPDIHSAYSVHSLKPQDIAVLSAIGLPHTAGSLMPTIMNGLYELLSLFNPDLFSLLPEEKYHDPVQQFGLLEQAEETALLLNQWQPANTERDWKLVVLFVQLDKQCACTEQVNVLVNEVDAALQLLRSQLTKAIISVAILDTDSDNGRVQPSRACPCPPDTSNWDHLLTTAIYAHVLLESLEHQLVKKSWYSNREDFTVQLQGVPLSAYLLHNTPLDEEHQAYKLVLQLWENLLQTASKQEDRDSEMLKIRCPSEEKPFLRTVKNSLSETRPGPRAASQSANAFMGTELPCEDMTPSIAPPTSVHEVRPADIGVVAALGDSLTAGNGVGSAPYNLLDVLTQYRGLSWSVGGDRNLSTVTTLANILREFNPELLGFSEGTGTQTTVHASLNQAVAGATSSDMLKQAKALVNRMKKDSRIDFHSDWKVITMFIGGNDLCDSCQNTLQYSTENFVKHIQEALDYLHHEVPRAIVNLLEPIHITPLREMHQDSTLKCPTWLVRIICPCVILPKSGSKSLQDLNDLNRAYQRGLVDLVESGRYDTHSNFTVVLQPFLRDITLPVMNGRPDRSFFSPDCFHLSQKAHTLMARGLWNNMLEPLGNKTHFQDFSAGSFVKCPSETAPFVQTYKNSNYTYAGPTPPPSPILNWGSDFSCKDTAPSSSVPTSVHRLRPADIKVVAALGDSITTGLGAKSQNFFQLSTEYEGVSWSIGGDLTLNSTTTLPNILRKFNPSLQGVSKGQGILVQKGFNMATSGAKASDLPAQVSKLLQSLQSSQTVNFQMDWKLITLLIGVSDICQYCLDQNNLSPQNYSHHLMEALDLLYKEVPRVLVNIIAVPQIDGLKKVKSNSLPCSLIPRNTCPCLIIPDDNSLEQIKLKLINLEYQTVIEQLISGGRYDGREDFTVVLQPYLQNTVFPLSKNGNVDPSYFTVDCLHLSERAHSEMAIALWNNMLEPVGKKQAFNNFTYDRTKIRCPSQSEPFIYTKMNSLPNFSTTSEPIIDTPVPTTQQSFCPSTIPIWVPVVLGVTGLLLGWGVTWLFLWRRFKKTKDKPIEDKAESKATNF
ncbi:phospholipase B1, membrane-associated isoform X2 [Brachyhypopomus gauderio]|uniref:phospholipase B1, membrane-associated isoform X2 n=1 Tax=Brachyhypopomus gauderio TaxID=698409 RepID=UPI0040434F62